MNYRIWTTTLLTISLSIPYNLSAAEDISLPDIGDLTPIVIADPVITDTSTNDNSSNKDSKTSKKEVVKVVPGTELSALGDSGLPDVKCPLIDGRVHMDLETVSASLASNIESLQSCEKPTDGNPYLANMNSIIAASKGLKTAFVQPEVIASDETKIAEVQSHIDSLIKGIDGLTTSLGSSGLVGSSCSKNAAKLSDILIGLGDVVEAATPYAMSALQMNPEFAPAIPFVIGAAGVGKVAKVIGKMNADHTLDMNDPKIRNAVLQNICEYTRIVQRNDQFKKARRGESGLSAGALSQAAAIFKVKPIETARYSMLAAALIEKNQEVQSVTSATENNAASDLIDIENLRKEIQTNGEDKNISCFTIRNQAAQADDTTKLVGRTLRNLVSLMNNSQTSQFITETNQSLYSGLLMAEVSLRKKILTGSGVDTDAAIKHCASYAKSYVQVLSRIASSAQSLASAVQTRADQVLSESNLPEVRSYAASANAERTEVRKISILTASATKLPVVTLGSDGSSTSEQDPISDSNIDRDIRLAREALFGSKPGTLPRMLGFSILTNYAKGDSPALAWFNDIAGMAGLSKSEFNDEVLLLRREAYRYHTRTGRQDYTETDANGKTHQNLPNMLEQIAIMRVDISSAFDLSILNFNQFKQGSEAHKNMCGRLTNTLNKWQGVIDHVNSLSLFCSYLKSYVDSSFDPRFVQACIGQKDWAGKVIAKSDLSDLKRSIREKSLKDAKLIQTKATELECSSLEQ